MCGIAGYIDIRSKPISDTSCIVSMLKVQKHRGPDDSGIRLFSLRSGQSVEMDVKEPHAVDSMFEGVLGFNRLSILDLSYNGHQPMVSPDNKVFLALNGEIYNAFDYKEELEDWGYKFKSTTDTEIVLALYLKYGFEDMLNRLNGMFAIVIVDLKKSVIFITRDRFGIKPLYYVLTSETFAFSSELKSFRYLEKFNFRLDEDQLDEYMIFRNNLKGTLFKDIQSLEPGHYITYTNGHNVIKSRYFDLNDYSRSTLAPGDIRSFGVQLEEWLNKSVKSQLMSDVKLGCQLSGGIDSSLVTWFANQNSGRGQFEGVSIIFRNPGFNEEKFIDHVSGKLLMPSHKFELYSSYYLDHFDKATWHLESPINHPNTIGIYLLSQRAKEHVTVLLSGEGADEVFGGYKWFYDIRYPFFNKRLLLEIKNNYSHPLQLAAYLNPVKRAVMATSFMNLSTAKKLNPDFNPEKATTNRETLYRSMTGTLFDRQVKYEMHSYLPDLLIRQDKMSMAHSIENRVPFLDNEVVANSFSIPEKYLLPRKGPGRCNTEKYLLKSCAANKFGKEFAFRKKMGFGIPIRNFFTEKSFADYLQDKVFPGIKDRKLFNYKLLYRWFSDISSIKHFELESLWIAITFEIWASIYLDLNYDNWNTSI